MELGVSLKERILNNINQVSIFAEYFELSTEEIKYSINNNSKVNNPLRTDNDPSLSFRWYGKKLIARDFGDIRYRGDIFEVVGVILGKNCHNNYDFTEICNDIIEQCSGHKVSRKETVLTDQEITLIQHEQLDIEIRPRVHTKHDYAFFNQFGLSRDIVDSKISSVRSYYLNDWLTPYKHNLYDPCYAYMVNPNKIKLYFPLRNKKDTKFITNNHFPIECITELHQIDYLILIKAYKDKLLIDKILEDNNITNVLVLPLVSETAKLHIDIVNLLYKYVLKHIFILLDTDITGIESMIYYQKTFGFEPIYFTKGYEIERIKDPTDLCKRIKYRKVEEKFINIYNQMINVY